MTTRKFWVTHSYATHRQVYATCSHDAAQKYSTDDGVRGVLVTVWTKDKSANTSYYVRQDGIVSGI